MPPACGTAMLMPSTSSRPSVFARLPPSDNSVPWALNVQELQGPVLTSCCPPRRRRHQHEQGVVAARGRDGLDHLVGQHRLALGALQVHHRRLAGDRDGLFERADAQVGVHADRRRARQLHALTRDRAEPGQHEPHRVDARAQVLDAVLPGAVADGRPHLFNQRRAGRLDRHAGQHRARRVSNDAGNRRLGVGGCRQQQDGETEEH